MRLKEFVLFGILSASAVVSCTRITPVEMTHTAIDETFFRIHIYAQKYGAVPASLDALPKREGYANRTTDGWGRPLVYRVLPDGAISLTSYGRDGTPGGSGDDADISVSYHTKRPDGSLWIGSDLWIVEAQVR
jgi:Type II secretion system (T2SS), protein G